MIKEMKSAELSNPHVTESDSAANYRILSDINAGMFLILPLFFMMKVDKFVFTFLNTFLLRAYS